MGEGNGGNDDRGLKARNRRWDRIPKAYYTNRRNRPNSEAYRRRLRMSSDSRNWIFGRINRIKKWGRV